MLQCERDSMSEPRCVLVTAAGRAVVIMEWSESSYAAASRPSAAQALR